MLESTDDVHESGLDYEERGHYVPAVRPSVIASLVRQLGCSRQRLAVGWRRTRVARGRGLIYLGLNLGLIHLAAIEERPLDNREGQHDGYSGNDHDNDRLVPIIHHFSLSAGFARPVSGPIVDAPSRSAL